MSDDPFLSLDLPLILVFVCVSGSAGNEGNTGKQTIYYPFPKVHSTPLTLFHTIPTFNDPSKKPFENIVEKGENAGNQHFLLFP